jgi:hypothetical protein
MVQTPPRQSVSVKELSKQMASARLDFEQGEVDERVRVLMEGMRGKSLNDDDFAAAGTEMNVIEFGLVYLLYWYKSTNTDTEGAARL